MGATGNICSFQCVMCKLGFYDPEREMSIKDDAARNLYDRELVQTDSKVLSQRVKYQLDLLVL